MGNRPQRLLAELLGTLLLTTTIGSGIAAQRLSPGDRGLELTESAMATAALGRRRWSDAALYIPVQVIGCGTGAALANAMFGTPAVQISSTARLTPASVPGFIVAQLIGAAIGLTLVLALSARATRTARTARTTKRPEMARTRGQ